MACWPRCSRRSSPRRTALAGPRRPPPPGASRPRRSSPAPCADSIFTCITIRVPRDHFASGGPTLDVTFALHRATAKTRKGVFVTVTGGPGTSGIAAADSYTEALDPRIVRDYDIVFFDQRGIGQSLPFQCPDASLAFSRRRTCRRSTRRARAPTPTTRRATPRTASPRAGIDPGLLPFLATRQAVEDLEAFRVLAQGRQLDLYGESYGTQYAQTYAAAHPSPPQVAVARRSGRPDADRSRVLRRGRRRRRRRPDDDPRPLHARRRLPPRRRRPGWAGGLRRAGRHAPPRAAAVPLRRRGRAHREARVRRWAISRPRSPATSTANSTGCCSSARSPGPRAASCSRSRGWPTSRWPRTPRRSRRSRTTLGRTPCSTASIAWTTTTARERRAAGAGLHRGRRRGGRRGRSGSGASSTATCRAPPGPSIRRRPTGPTT